MSVQIREYKPSQDLSSFIELYWEGEFNLTREHSLRQQVAPNGFVELIIHLSDDHCYLPDPTETEWSHSPDYTIIGLYSRPYEVRFRQYVPVFGIRFKPEGIYNLFGIPAAEFTESYEDMELVLGARFRDFCSRLRETTDTSEKLALSEAYLIKHLENSSNDLTYLNHAAEMIRSAEGFDRIEELPGKVYISLRQLEREFRRKIGTTPKHYMRIARLNEVHRKLEEGKPVEFAKVAFDCGYADQAHFIRDFKKFMGVKPTLFIRNKNSFIVNPQLASTLA